MLYVIIVVIAIILVVIFDVDFFLACLMAVCLLFLPLFILAIPSKEEKEKKRQEEEKARFYQEDPELLRKCRERAKNETQFKHYSLKTDNNGFFISTDVLRREDRERLTDKYYREAMEKKRREELERQRREAERLRILNEKTQQIQKENEYIGQDYVRWNELNAQSSVTTKTLHPCKKLLTLLDNVADDCDVLSEINKLLQPFDQIAIEKQTIIDRVEKVAALYGDIGNSQEAHKLKEKFGL